MNRRSLTKAHMLLLAFILAAQGTTAAAAGQKGVSVPTTLGPIVAPVAATTNLPNAALPTVLPGASSLPTAAATIPHLPQIPVAAAAQPTLKGTPSLRSGEVGTPQAAAANMAKIGEGLAPQIEGIAAPAASAAGSAEAGHAIQAILQGGKAAASGNGVFAAAGSASSASGLTPAASGSSNKGGNGDGKGPEAPKPAAAKPVESRMAYAYRRWALGLVAQLTGAVYSLPQAGPKLTAAIMKEAAYKDAVLSDIDDTLGRYNTVLEKETVDGIVGMLDKGKLFAAITDRPDFARAGSSQLGAMDSFASVPEDKRVGLIIATNGGGKIYEGQADGAYKLIYEEANLPESEREIVKAAADVVRPQLEGLGTGLQLTDPKDPSKPMVAENHGPYGFSMILKAGTPEATVKQVAHLMEAAMHERGLTYEVEGRMAKDATLPPYITFSKLNKSLAVKRIAEIRKLEADRTILIGDSMYAPKVASKSNEKMEKWAERMSGRALPLTGNATDRNMELGMPGALTISVGGTADPRMSNAYVIDAKNAEGTRRVLNAVASTAFGAQSGRAKAGAVAALLGLFAIAIMTYGGIFYAVTHAPAAQQYQDDGNYPPGVNPNFDMNDFFR